jgi:hypothetical protein
MDSDVLIASFHASTFRSAWVFTGGWARVAGQLLSVPGGSRSILEITIPYCDTALADYLGWRPEQYCSVDTARDLALAARKRARRLDPLAVVLGFGCTASLRSDRPKRGDHRVHLAAATRDRVLCHSLTLCKEARSRAEEEDLVARLLLNLAAEVAGLKERVEVPLLAGEQVVLTETVYDPLTEFLEGRVETVCIEPDGQVRDDGPRPQLVVPGSFNPVHEGHLRLGQVAAQRVGVPAAYELSMINVDKPPLLPQEVRRRVKQFAGRAPLWLTRAPTFDRKAALFPQAHFVVGADTAARIVDPRFYTDSVERMEEALDLLRRRGCRFLVAGRVDHTGFLVGLDNLKVPPSHRPLFEAIPESAFRCDISSTQLRAEKRGD